MCPGSNDNNILYYILLFLCIVAPLPIDGKQGVNVYPHTLIQSKVPILGVTSHLTCISISIAPHIYVLPCIRIIM